MSTGSLNYCASVLVSAARLKSLAFAEGSALQSNCRDFEWERDASPEPSLAAGGGCVSSTAAMVLPRFAPPASPLGGFFFFFLPSLSVSVAAFLLF